jgi:hypothetical protein
MSQPMDPNRLPDGESEYSWGAGLFKPGIANGEGQKRQQDDFGANMHPPVKPIGDRVDNWARMVADKRTDPCDPESNRDFETAGNPDRYGANPALVQAPTQKNVSQHPNIPLGLPPLERKS